MSQSATPATQNDMTTCLDTFEKDRFSSFPHRHGDARGKPATRDKTRGCRKTSTSYETFSNFHSWQRDKRTSFAASPIDTARPRRDARRDRWEHQNEHFVRDFLQFSRFVASKSTFSYDFSLEPENLQPQNRCFVRGFRQFAAQRTKCHACHGICTSSPLDAALPMRFTKTRNRTRLKCCACHEKCRWTRPKCCACHENCNTSSENVTKVLRLPRKTIFNTLQNTSECHKVPRLPRETKQRHV